MNEITLAVQIAMAVISLNICVYLLGRERERTGNSLLVMMGTTFLYNVVGIGVRYSDSGLGVYISDVLYHFLEIILWISTVILIRDILGMQRRWRYVLVPIAIFGVIIILRLSDPWLGLYYQDVSYELLNGRAYMSVDMGVGAWLYTGMHVLVTVGLFLTALRENFRLRKDSNRLKRRRGVVILVVTMLPFLNFYFLVTQVFYKREAAMVTLLLQGLLLLHAILYWRAKGLVRDANTLIVENMDLGIIIVDKSYCYLDSNRFAQRLYPVLETLQKEDSLREKAPEIYEMFEENGARRFQIENGYYECQVFHVNPEDKIQGYVAGIYDVTEQTKYLNGLVFRRQKAEEISRRKSVLLANASHEIRTPMNVIMGMSELCLRKNSDPEITYGLRSIYNSGQGLLEVVESILDLSKSELENQQPIEALYSLERLLMEVASLMQTKLCDKPIEFELELKSPMPKWVYGDSGKIRAILVNILGNADKYTKKGKIQLALSVKEEGETVVLSIQVSDTGIGMKQEEADKIFNTFVRGQEAEASTISGTGLGLAITRQLVEMLNGSIRVESRLGEGSTFFVDVCQKKVDGPYRKAGIIPEEDVREYLLRERIITEVNTSYDRVNALVVDDLEVNTLVAQGILGLYGMKVDVANSGKQVLDMVKSKVYDLFFIDLRMPEMSGEELLTELRQIEAFANTPMIALTASNDSETIQHAEKVGFDELLTKPIEKPMLEQVLKKYFPEYSKTEIPKTMETENEMNRDRRRILNSYYLQISKMQGQLMQQAEERLEDFVISVHGMKGASRSIGAVEMAEYAQRMEMAGKEGRIEDIRSMFPEFLDMLDSTLNHVKDEMEMLESKKREAVDSPEMAHLEEKVLRKLMGALRNFELDEAEELLDSLAGFSYEQEEQELLSELQNDVAELDYEIAIGKIEDFLGKIS